MAQQKSTSRAETGSLLVSQVDDRLLFDGESVAYDIFMSLLYTAGGVSHGANHATVLDLHALKELSDEQLLTAAAVQIGANHGEFSDGELTSEHYHRINNALRTSVEFITGELGYKLKDAVARTTVNNRAELVRLLRKVSAFHNGDKGLESHLQYCALIKGALAALELETHAARELSNEANWLQNLILTQTAANDHTPLVIPIPFSGQDGELRGMLTDVGELCPVTFSLRDKTWGSIMRKFCSVPESTAQQAFKDELAMRFKIDGRRMGTVARIMEYLHTHCGARGLKIANKGGIQDPEEFTALYEKLTDTVACKNLKVDSSVNPKSAANFSVLQINGVLTVPTNGGSDSLRERSFEIQFVDTKRRPNTGMASDAVYALKKDIIIATRFFGSMSLEWLKKRAESTSRDAETGMSVKEIIGRLERNGFLFKKAGRNKYAATDVWTRWLKIPGLIVDDNIRFDLQHRVQKALDLLVRPGGPDSVTVR